MTQQLRAVAGLCETSDWFGPQHPNGSLQPSVTPVPGNPTHSLASEGTRHTHGTHIDMQAKQWHINTKNKKDEL